jgi:hypothetical protein
MDVEVSDFVGVLDVLQRVSRTLDLMWRSAVANGSDAAASLGEASHGVHRAIIALLPPIGSDSGQGWAGPSLSSPVAALGRDG